MLKKLGKWEEKRGESIQIWTKPWMMINSKGYHLNLLFIISCNILMIGCIHRKIQPSIPNALSFSPLLPLQLLCNTFRTLILCSGLLLLIFMHSNESLLRNISRDWLQSAVTRCEKLFSLAFFLIVSAVTFFCSSSIYLFFSSIISFVESWPFSSFSNLLSFISCSFSILKNER